MLSAREKRQLKRYIAEDNRRLSEVFDALSDNNRCQLFRLFIKHQNLNVTEIAMLFNISVPLTSQHLKILEQSRMLTRKKAGRQVFYHINNSDPVVRSVVKAILM